MSALSAPYMHDEASAFAHVEVILWPAGPVCPKCGVIGEAYELKGVRTKKSRKHPEGKVRHGLKKCKACGKQFTVRIGTVFEGSHIDLHLWLQAIYLMTSSKKGISSHRLSRTLGITVKSAWFMSRRIRETMHDDGAAEFEFRYNNRIANGPDDAARAAIAPRGVKGKRLLYRESL